jgi:hypothetical protein
MMSTENHARNDFARGQRVSWQESRQYGGDGPILGGTVSEVHPPDVDHPNGGEYSLSLDDGDSVLAWCEEIAAEIETPVPPRDPHPEKKHET